MRIKQQETVPEWYQCGVSERPRPLRAAKRVSTLFLIGASVLSLSKSPAIAVQSMAAQSKTSSAGEITVTSPVLDAVTQNTPGYSEGFPAAVPRQYSWCSGSYKPADNAKPPSDFTAVTGWGQVYPKAGTPKYVNPEATILIANAKTYVHLSATREWLVIQDQADDEIAGAHFVADLVGNQGREMKVTALPDGTSSLEPPPAGYNNLFWIIKRGAYDAGRVDGVYVQMDMKTNDPNIKLVANVGADWWRDPTAEYVQGFNNNRGAGTSNWVELSTRWSTLHFYSGNNMQFLADPPPPLAEFAQRTEPVIAPRRANAPSICPMGSLTQ